MSFNSRINPRGYLTIYDGIPSFFNKEQKEKLLKKYGEDCFFKDCRKLENRKNIVVRGGKDILLKRMASVGNSFLTKISLGDGASNFDSDGNPGTLVSLHDLGDSFLFNSIFTKDIDFVGNIEGSVEEGYSIKCYSVFFSHLDGVNFSGVNVNNKKLCVNEISLEADGIEIFSMFDLANYSFDPSNKMALTFEWEIRIR